MFRRVATAPDPLAAGMIRDLLHASGVRVLEQQHSPHVSLAGTDACYYVEVLAEDHARAVAVLQEEGHGKWVVP